MEKWKNGRVNRVVGASRARACGRVYVRNTVQLLGNPGMLVAFALFRCCAQPRVAAKANTGTCFSRGSLPHSHLAWCRGRIRKASRAAAEHMEMMQGEMGRAVGMAVGGAKSRAAQGAPALCARLQAAAALHFNCTGASSKSF